MLRSDSGPPLARREDPLAHGQLVLHRGGPDRRIVDRHLAFDEDVETLVRECLADDLLGLGVEGRIAGQEEVADAEGAEVEVGPAGHPAEEAQREVEVDARAVADALRRHAAAVRDRAQRLVQLADDLVGLSAVLAGQEADAAAALLGIGIVEPPHAPPRPVVPERTDWALDIECPGSMRYTAGFGAREDPNLSQGEALGSSWRGASSPRSHSAGSSPNVPFRTPALAKRV